MIIHTGTRIKLGLKASDEVRVNEYLGSGGFGDVWQVQDTTNHKHYALKHIRLRNMDPDRLAVLTIRMMNEASVDIASPYVVETYGLTKLGELEYGILSEYVSGKELGEWIRENGSLPWEAKKRMFLQVLSGVSAAHKQGVIHKDLKPDNILVTEDNAPKILDFGLAKIKNMNVTKTGDLAGTLPYMAPEMLAGARDVDHRFDIYSLGCILYVLVRGRNYCEMCGYDHPPFMKMMAKERLSKGNILDFDKRFSHPDSSVGRAINRATTFDPAFRFRDVDEFIKSLSGVSTALRLLWTTVALLVCLALTFAVGFGVFAISNWILVGVDYSNPHPGSLISAAVVLLFGVIMSFAVASDVWREG